MKTLILKYFIKLPLLFCIMMCIAFKSTFSHDYQFDISEKGYAFVDYSISQNNYGYFVAVWYDERNSYLFEGDEYGGAVYGQIFDMNLNPIGSNIRISEPLEKGLSRQPDVLLLDDGRYIVVWTESTRHDNTNGSNETSRRRIVMTLRTIEGDVIIPETGVDENPEQVGVSSPSIYKLPGDRFLITWNEPGRGRYGQYFFMDGTPDGNNFSMIHPVLNVTSSGVHVVSDELYFKSYLTAPIVLPESVQWIQYYDASHSPVGVPIKLERRGRITPFGEDTILVEYMSEYRTEIYIRFLGSNGKALSEPILVNDDGGIRRKLAPKIARNPEDGSFVVVWEDERNGPSDIYAQRFDSNAKQVGGNFKVNHEEWEFRQVLANIRYRKNNQYLITWYESRLICTNIPPGVYVGNMRDSYILATVLDYDNPNPGQVLGREFARKQCEFYEQPIPFVVKNNYPNPFNNFTNIVIEVNTRVVFPIDVVVYDLMGREIWRTEIRVGQGIHEIPFYAQGLSSGIYFARVSTLHAPELTQITPMLLMK